MQETDDTQKAILGITWVESGISVENLLTSCQYGYNADTDTMSIRRPAI